VGLLGGNYSFDSHCRRVMESLGKDEKETPNKEKGMERDRRQSIAGNGCSRQDSMGMSSCKH
jgi:hypothetical protein